MKKVIIGAAAVGALVGLGIVGRRIGHEMREHCGQMAAQCRQMMAGREETDQGASQFVGQGEAVGVA